MTEEQAQLIDRRVGESLRMRRISLGMNQMQLAGCLGVTYQQVQKYENGKTRLSPTALCKAAAALGMEPGYFFEGLEINRETDADTRDVINSFKAISPTFGLYEFMELNTAFLHVRSAKLRGAFLNLMEGMA